MTANIAERVFVDDAGQGHCDPWALFGNWLDHEGHSEAFDSGEWDVIERLVNLYASECEGSAQTLCLSLIEADL